MNREKIVSALFSIIIFVAQSGNSYQLIEYRSMYIIFNHRPRVIVGVAIGHRVLMKPSIADDYKLDYGILYI